MRIYFDHQRDVLVVEGSKQVYPAKALRVTYEGDKISVWQAEGQTRVLKANYSAIFRQDGSGFANIADLVTYLELEFSKTAIINGGFF